MEDFDNIQKVMKYFNCNEDMARKIIKSSVMNGGHDAIKHLCENDWKERNYHA